MIKFLLRFSPFSVSAEKMVDQRDVIISSATVEDIEAGFKRNYDMLNNEDEKPYTDIFKQTKNSD